jgi:uncharacterized membrane protein YadS
MDAKRVLALAIMFLGLLIYFQILLYTGSEETALVLQKTLVSLLLGNRSYSGGYSGTRLHFDEEDF